MRVLITAALISACGAGTEARPAAPAAAETQRFDAVVREHFFAGFAGDRNQLQRGLDITEQALARNPAHAEALVWHGAGVMFQAGEAFRQGQRERGISLWKTSIDEMARGVELEPDRVGVRVPRGAALLASYPFIDHAPTRTLHRELGIADYERAIALHGPRFGALSTHSRGELLVALADAWADAGDVSRASHYYDRMRSELGGTPYAQRGDAWLAGNQKPLAVWRCQGCH